MKRLYLDTNIILDFLLNRLPFASAAEDLFTASENGKVVVLISSLTFITAHYIISKAIGKVLATQALASLAAQTTIVAVDATIINQALQAGYPDFEDAVQLFAALAAGADTIITRDAKGFKNSSIAILDPLAALAAIS